MKKEAPIKFVLPRRVKRLKANDLPDIANAFLAFANSQNSNRSRVAKALGMPLSSLNDLLKGRNPRIELLLALSEGLEYNLLDLYIRLLPERLRATTETRQLQEQLEEALEEKDALQKKLEAAERDRDIYLSLLQGKK